MVDEDGQLLNGAPDFNQPIELDNNNEEFIWYKIKINIICTFRDLKINDENKYSLGRIKHGVNMVMNKKLLFNDNILKNKDKFKCIILLIINPYIIEERTAEFYANLLLSTKLTNQELENYKKQNQDIMMINLKILIVYV